MATLWGWELNILHVLAAAIGMIIGTGLMFMANRSKKKDFLNLRRELQTGYKGLERAAESFRKFDNALREAS